MCMSFRLPPEHLPSRLSIFLSLNILLQNKRQEFTSLKNLKIEEQDIRNNRNSHIFYIIREKNFFHFHSTGGRQS